MKALLLRRAPIRRLPGVMRISTAKKEGSTVGNPIDVRACHMTVGSRMLGRCTTTLDAKLFRSRYQTSNGVIDRGRPIVRNPVR